MMFSTLWNKCFSDVQRRWPAIVAIFAFAFIASTPLCVASGFIRSKPDIPSITLTKGHNGRQVTVPVGARIVVELPFLGSAGYGWHIEKPGDDFLQFVREETKPPDATEKEKIGGPVLGRWHFLAVKQGMTSIRMHYYRAWEGAGTALDHFTVVIKIEQEESP